MKIDAHPFPESAFLQKYNRLGNHTDCYGVEVDFGVSHEEFVSAFYTTWLFKLERWILGWAVNRPSTDSEAIELAQGRRERFAAWDVESRSEHQLLLCDMHGRTRSWLMTSADVVNAGGTRLWFGSAVVPCSPVAGKTASLGFPYSALLGFHKLYSRCLLRAACSKLQRLKTA